MIASQDIIKRCLATPPDGLGFAAAGVCAAAPTARPEALNKWLDAGKHGEMTYLDDYRDTLQDPRQLLAGAKSIICVADRYHNGAADRHTPGVGRIARYARGEDYHRVLKKRLFEFADWMRSESPAHQTKVCVDTAPLLEREHAARAGLGRIGKHTLLIGDEGLGSWLLLGAVVTTLEVAPTHHQKRDELDNPCGSCTRCIDACPTDAITPFSVDGTRCISYLTIEHRSDIDAAFHEPMGDWLFGCDICQEVCPHNQPTRRSKQLGAHAAYVPRQHLSPGLDLLSVLGWSEEDRRAACMTSALKRAKLAMFRRNALIALGNQYDELSSSERDTAMQRLRAIADDEAETEMVRRTASDVLARWSARRSDHTGRCTQRPV